MALDLCIQLVNAGYKYIVFITLEKLKLVNKLH